MPQQFPLPKMLALALIVAVLCNGAAFYLKRTGLIDPASYRAYWTAHCWELSETAGAQTERQCSKFTSPAELARRSQLPDESAEGTYGYLYESTPAERPLKLVKDLFWVVLIALCLKAPLPHWRRIRPLGALAVYCAVAFVLSIPVNGALIAVAGLRSFLFLFLALFGQWLVAHLAVFARAVGALLIVQALLIPLELFRGVHLFHEWTSLSLASRIAGTLVQPNSMGVFAVAALAFYYCFSPRKSWLVPLGLVALALVFLSGSGTGLVCAALALFVIARERVHGKWKMVWTVAGGLGVAAIVLMLPDLTGREDVFDSLWASGGRLAALHAALFERGLAEVVFGSGLGVNTNAALNLAAGSGLDGLAHTSLTGAVPTDSTLTGLLIQIGVVGTLIFYAAFLWAALRDSLARPFYCIVALCTLTINVTELFPVNVLLGMAWAHSAWNPTRRP
jgi:hypothetical protein